MNTVSKQGRRIDKNRKSKLFNRYQGHRIEPKNNLKKKRTLLEIKLFLCALMVFNLNGSISTYSTYNSNDISITSKTDLKRKPKIILNPILHLKREIDVDLPVKNIFIGDSRTQGILLSGAIDEEDVIYGVGYGYKWFIGDGNFNSSKTNAVNGALNQLRSIMNDGETYNIIVWLGVNDLKYKPASIYFEEFYKLATDELSSHKLYIVSVGPVSNYHDTTISNAQINRFNDELKDLVLNSGIDNLKYIDLEDYDLRIRTYDDAGIHYGYKDYQNVYDIIISSIEKENTLKRESN